jgi:hypothetical protein
MPVRLLSLLILAALLTTTPAAHAQKKADRREIAQLQADITYLASDELEGRRTGTKGESIAADYIVKQYKDAGILPYKNEYYYPFHFTYGKEISGATQVRVGIASLRVPEDAFPLAFSANKRVTGDVLPDVMEQGNIALVALYTDATNADDPHFDAEKVMNEKAKEMEKQGATGVVFYDSYGSKWEPSFNKHSEYEPLGIPVVYMSNTAYRKYIFGNDKSIPIDLNILINRSERTASNIAAYIDNGAKYTVIIGAHYDHLGYGEDGNSLFANAVKEHQIHHGADDNASGTAAVLQIAKWVKSKKLKHYNYLFINFTGEELGLYGSKAFVKDQNIDSAHIAYMMNLDMVGRLNDSTHALTLGGVGTSPVWEKVVSMGGEDFKLVIDSSGVGPSDHTSFYNAGIPVLFFFTGTHKDYHKPSDKPELINYPGEVQVIKYATKVLAMMDKEPAKPGYLVTKQKTMGKSSFKVTLGIMPDYTFETGGVRVDGVSDNRPAIKAGIKQGDIITQLGDNKINGMQSYMDALGKFSPGDKTKVTVTRDGKVLVLPIELSK